MTTLYEKLRKESAVEPYDFNEIKEFVKDTLIDRAKHIAERKTRISFDYTRAQFNNFYPKLNMWLEEEGLSVSEPDSRENTFVVYWDRKVENREHKASYLYDELNILSAIPEYDFGAIQAYVVAMMTIAAHEGARVEYVPVDGNMYNRAQFNDFYPKLKAWLQDEGLTVTDPGEGAYTFRVSWK